MSDDPTKDLGEKYDTKPTLETLLSEVRAGFQAVERRFEDLENGFNVRLDRIESLASTTRGEMLALRADFNELKAALREHFPAVK